MGDRAWAKLVIGGSVSREALAELLLDKGYNPDDAKEGTDGHEDLYLERRAGGHVVVLEDCDQLGAMWEGLEAALVEAGIAFDRSVRATPARGVTASPPDVETINGNLRALVGGRGPYPQERRGTLHEGPGI